jgi:hypothetical protein
VRQLKLRAKISGPQSLIFPIWSSGLKLRTTVRGIPTHLRQRILFDPFVQGDLGLNRKYGGTGLGLSIGVQPSPIMGGVTLLHSQEGRGSKFTLRVSLKFVKELAPSTLAPSIPGSRTPTVLSRKNSRTRHEPLPTTVLCEISRLRLALTSRTFSLDWWASVNRSSHQLFALPPYLIPPRILVRTMPPRIKPTPRRSMSWWRKTTLSTRKS